MAYIWGRKHLSPRIQYLPLAQIVQDTHKWIEKIPSDFDVVIGIPRTGMFPACIIACELGKPLTTPDLYCNDVLWMSQESEAHNNVLKKYGRVLLVDDSGCGLRTVNHVITQIRVAHPETDIKVAVLYPCEQCIPKIDYWYKPYVDGESPRHFLNLMHHDDVSTAIDMDGVLCEDYNVSRDYNEFLKNARPYRIPIYEVQCIITGRPESCREITKQWLEKYHVRYQRLHMWGGKEDMGTFKARILLHEKPFRYIESSDHLARECYVKSGITCYAMDSGRFYGDKLVNPKYSEGVL